jgi:hypothetical protein
MKKKVCYEMLLDQNNKWHDKKEKILLVLTGTYGTITGSVVDPDPHYFGRIPIGNADPDPREQKLPPKK